LSEFKLYQSEILTSMVIGNECHNSAFDAVVEVLDREKQYRKEVTKLSVAREMFPRRANFSTQLMFAR